MKAVFDDSAAGYDAGFTNTAIGRSQRNHVWDYLDHAFDKFPTNVLELNCGTGEDAVFFARHGSYVTATDVSENMLLYASKKIAATNLAHLVSTKQLDLTDISKHKPDEKYDLVFSDFGGLNCIGPQQLQQLMANIAGLLQPGGRLVLVVMSRFCAWESLYFISRLDLKKAFRRNTSAPQKARLGETELDTWYYSPAHIRKTAHGYFRVVDVRPIGLTLPPSYLNPAFSNRQRMLQSLDRIERKLNKFSSLSALSDHYLIDLALK
jgi:cyclopropane fatty-acyl-phospholipid synthase-like methyltransferase